jgi:hypothetical protein
MYCTENFNSNFNSIKVFSINQWCGSAVFKHLFFIFWRGTGTKICGTDNTGTSDTSIYRYLLGASNRHTAYRYRTGNNLISHTWKRHPISLERKFISNI